MTDRPARFTRVSVSAALRSLSKHAPKVLDRAAVRDWATKNCTTWRSIAAFTNQGHPQDCACLKCGENRRALAAVCAYQELAAAFTGDMLPVDAPAGEPCTEAR